MMTAAPFMAWARAVAKPMLTNWAGNVTYSTDRVSEAGTVEEVRQYIQSHEKLKVLGTRHCFNNIADSKDNFLSLKPMHEVVSIDEKARTVTVGSGISYGLLSPQL